MRYLINYKYKDKLGIVIKKKQYCNGVDDLVNTIKSVDYYNKKILYLKVKYIKS